MKRMYRSMEIKGAVEERKHDDGRTIYRAVATSDALDRYGDIVLPAGADLKNFNANPVLLGIHDYEQVTIGHVLSLEIREKDIIAEFVFAKDDLGQRYETRYKDGDMRAFSIGFAQKKDGVVELWSWWDDEPEIKDITVELPDGTEKKISFKGMDQVPHRIFTNWELLELSAVPVPANPEALLMRQAEGIIRKAMTENPNMKSFAQQQVREIMEPLLKHLRSLEDADESLTVDGSVRSHSVDVRDDLEFNSSEAKAKMAKWASKDSTGEKDTINWAKMSEGFASFDAKKVDNFGSYKFLHHDIVDDALVVSWGGLKAAMSALLAEIDGESISDEAKAAYDHLASHYESAGKTAPELRAHTDEECVEIKSAPFVEEKSEAVSQPATAEDGTDEGSADAKSADGEESDAEHTCNCTEKRLVNLIKTIEERFEEFEQYFLTLNIKATAIHDLLELRAPLQKAVGGNNGSGDAEAVLEIGADLLDRLGNLAE